MGEKPTYWYTDALKSCFGDPPGIRNAVFLKVFAAPMCIPCGGNYGKPEADRKAGPISKDQRRLLDEVTAAQVELLENYAELAKSWSPDSETVESRMQKLSDDLMNRHLEHEKGYADKHTSYKAHNFLSLFLNAEYAQGMDCEKIFHKAANYYGSVMEKIYAGMNTVMAQRLTSLKNELQRVAPGFDPVIPAPYTQSTSAEMGWCMCALLLLTVVKNKLTADGDRLTENLLGVTFMEAGRTVSVATISKVPLNREKFCCICAAALRSDLELKEIRCIYQVFLMIQNYSEGQLDMELYDLLEKFIQAMEDFGTRRSQEIASDWSRSGQLLEEINEVRGLYDICKKWLI